MAYNNNTQTEIASIPRNLRGDAIKVSKIEDAKGNIAVDIRNYYTAEDGELRPTQKGVRFNDELGAEVILAMIQAVSLETAIDLQDKLEGMLGQVGDLDKGNEGVEEKEDQ